MDIDTANNDSRQGFFDKLFHRQKSDEQEEFEEELISKVNEGHESGAIKASEAEMIRNIFAFDDKVAKDIMQHRTNILALDGDMTVMDALTEIVDKHYSRYPVYLGDLDNIIGIIHIKDVLRYIIHGHDQTIKLSESGKLVRTAFFIPETHSLNTLFAQMQHRKTHMVIVQDEYGQTSGLLSMEDLLEEIVGSIQDEYDTEDERVSVLGKGHFVMQGSTPIHEVCQALSIDLKDEESETLNGFLLEQLGHIPRDHESFEVDAYGYRFHVMDVLSMVAQTVEITRIGSLESAVGK